MKITNTKSNNIYLNIREFFESNKVEAVFFTLFCATVFYAAMLHWRLDIDHNLSVFRGGLVENLFDFRFVFGVEIILILYYSIRKYLLGFQYRFDFALTILITAMVLVGVLDYHRQEYLIVQYAWLLPAPYILAKLVISSNHDKIGERVEKVFFSLAFGMFIASAMDFYANYRIAYYYKVLNTESWISYWVWSEESRCTYELGFILVTASFGYMMYKARHHVLWLALVALLNGAIQYVDRAVEGRENRLLLVINIFVVFLLFIFDNWKKLSVKKKNVIKGIVLSGIVLVVCATIAFLSNIGGLHDRYLASNWSAGGGVLTNVRFQVDWAAFKLMLQYPTENYANYTNVYDFYYQAHSMLLEYGRLNGITVYIALVIFRLMTIKDAIVLSIDKSAYSWVKYFLVPGFISINLYYSMEPNGYAHRYFFMIGLLISGLIRGYNEVSNR